MVGADQQVPERGQPRHRQALHVLRDGAGHDAPGPPPGPRPRRSAAAQLRDRGGDAVHHAARGAVRQRRLPGHPAPRARALRLRRLARRAGAGPRGGPAAGHRHRHVGGAGRDQSGLLRAGDRTARRVRLRGGRDGARGARRAGAREPRGSVERAGVRDRGGPDRGRRAGGHAGDGERGARVRLRDHALALPLG